MERIQQAIEKAKRQRSLTKNHEKGSGPNTVAGFSSNIQYTQTPTVELNRETLLENKIIAGLLNQPEAAMFKQLRTQVLQAMREKQWRSIGIVSPTTRSGASVIAANLAISFSLEVNQTVLLVDLDLHTPQLAQLFGIEAEAGIADLLHQKASLREVLINPQYERLVLLPGMPISGNTSELLSSPTMDQLQNELIQRYDDRFVFYDLPPLLVNDDALAFLPNVDAVLLVIEDGGSSSEELEKTKKLLEGKPIIGSVVNKLKV